MKFHFINLVQSKWIEPVIKGSVPSVRWLHSANIVNNKIFCFGGSAGTGHFLNDLHILSVGIFNRFTKKLFFFSK
jgi:hypothetical protein